MAHNLTESDRDRDYQRSAEDLQAFGLQVTFSDESEIVGEEEDGSPVLFVEVSHPTRGIITQRPARELAALAWGFQACHFLQAQGAL